VNEFAQSGKHVTAPVRKLFDLFVYEFRWIHSGSCQV
jgi:hypothetical protein